MAIHSSIDEWKGIGLEGDTAAMLIAQADGVDSAACADLMRQHFQDAGADFADVSTNAAEAAQLLDIRRLAYPAAERLGRCLVEDVGVPRSKLQILLADIERAGVSSATINGTFCTRYLARSARRRGTRLAP